MLILQKSLHLSVRHFYLLLVAVWCMGCGNAELRNLEVSAGLAGLYPIQIAAITANDTVIAAGEQVALEAAAVDFTGFDLLDTLNVVGVSTVSSVYASEVTLEISEGDFNFGQLRAVRFFIAAQGVEERLLASLDTIPTNSGSRPLELRPSGTELRQILLEGGPERPFSIRSEWIFREDVKEDAVLILNATIRMEGEI